jgi:hypothetical protein
MKIFAFSASCLNEIACGRRGNYSQNMHLTRAGTRPAYFDYGELMHFLCEFYYKDFMQGISKVQSRDHAITEARSFYPQLELPIEECEQCISNFIEYTKYYQNDGWTPLRVEEPFTVELFRDDDFPWNDGDKGLRLIAEGIIDLEIQNANQNELLVDHKTPGRRQEPETLSYQFMLYCLVRDKRKIVVNAIGKQKSLGPSEKFNRYERMYSKEVLDEFAAGVILRVIRWLRTCEAEDYEPDFTCCHKFNSDCQYLNICRQEPKMRDRVIQSGYTAGEPYNIWKKRKVDERRELKMKEEENIK